MTRRLRPTTRSRTTIYRGRVITVERDVVALGQGRPVAMDVVRHRGSVVLVPQPSRSDVILIRQFRYVVGRWLWELPAGSLEPGESPAHAARRECEEETGWKPETLVRLGAYYPTPGFCDEKLTFYACRDLRRPKRPPRHDPDEQIEATRFSVREVWRMIERGQVIDMKTIVGVGLISGRLPTKGR
jgi:ADP-ribose pyrophosphatase